MALTVNSDCTINLNVSDADLTNTLAAAGDKMEVSSSTKKTFGASPDPTLAMSWSGTFSLASTTTTLDLTALTGPRGSTVTFASIRQLLIINTSTGVGFVLTVGGAATPFTPNSLTGTWVVAENSRDYSETLGTAWTVDSSHKLLKFDSGAHTVTFKVFITGS
jgi:hypothetical protein